MTQQSITTIAQYALDLVLALALGAFVRYVAPYIKSRTEAARLEHTKSAVKEAVAAAEARFIGDKLGASVRKPWVKAVLQGLDIASDELVDAMIDAAAKALKGAVDPAEEALYKAINDTTNGRVSKDKATDLIDALTGPQEAQGTQEATGGEGK